MKYLVTGATGQLGSLVVERLIELVPASLEKAFTGVERLLMISTNGENRLEHQKTAVEMAKKAGVQFIAYTSVANVHQAQAGFDDHYETEQFIQASGIPYAFLRNNWYVENEGMSMQAAIQGTPWVNAVADAKIGWAARRDYVHAAAHVLTQAGHEGKTYELSGKLLTTAELAEIVATATEKSIAVQDVDIEGFGEIMAATGMPAEFVEMMKGMQNALRQGMLEVESKDLEFLLGRPQQPLAEVVKEMIRS